MDKLLRVGEVAKRLDVTVARAYELIRRGVIPSVALVRQRRVDARALEEFISHGGLEAAPGPVEGAVTGSSPNRRGQGHT